eukprot:TRINITY_DN36776_c0_g1_i1.p1 TRINITY_DN36776_c0_g1~~TRINITY_DN36776_c0_g1_i1.p1  ORF type:complete len:339 (+),score=15.82 TRINITY_DN36776_c0_g1_i1:52-1017(+)
MSRGGLLSQLFTSPRCFTSEPPTAADVLKKDINGLAPTPNEIELEEVRTDDDAIGKKESFKQSLSSLRPLSSRLAPSGSPGLMGKMSSIGSPTLSGQPSRIGLKNAHVNTGVDPLPIPELDTRSVHLSMALFIQIITGVLCYASWFRHQESELGTRSVNAYVAIIAIGLIVYFGVVYGLLIKTLSAATSSLSRREVRHMRYTAVVLQWVCHDLPIFVVEFDAFLSLGLVDFFQALSLITTSACVIFPPWYIYLRVTTDYLAVIYGPLRKDIPAESQHLIPRAGALPLGAPQTVRPVDELSRLPESPYITNMTTPQEPQIIT